MDSTSIKVHQHAAGAKKGGENTGEVVESTNVDEPGGLNESIESPHQDNQGIGVSRGGKNTKIHALVDGLGNPIKLIFITENTSDAVSTARKPKKEKQQHAYY